MVMVIMLSLIKLLLIDYLFIYQAFIDKCYHLSSGYHALLFLFSQELYWAGYYYRQHTEEETEA